MKTISGVSTRHLESQIAAHVHVWEQIKRVGKSLPKETFPFITLSREYGCGALSLALTLVAMLNERFHPPLPWVVYERELLDRVARELNTRRDIVESIDGRRRDAMTELFDSLLNLKVDEVVVFRKLAEVIRSLAVHGNSVIVGRGSYWLTQGLKNGLHVRLVAPRDWRIANIATGRNLTFNEAAKIVALGEKQRNQFIKTYFVSDAERPMMHDLTINMAQFNVAQAAEIVTAALAARFGEVVAPA